MSDLKSTVKAVKAALDGGKPAEAVTLATPLLAGSSLETTAAADGKQKPMAYTLCAFAGLAHLQQKQMDTAEACFKRATQIQADQYPAWKVSQRPHACSAERRYFELNCFHCALSRSSTARC